MSLHGLTDAILSMAHPSRMPIQTRSWAAQPPQRVQAQLQLRQQRRQQRQQRQQLQLQLQPQLQQPPPLLLLQLQLQQLPLRHQGLRPRQDSSPRRDLGRRLLPVTSADYRNNSLVSSS